MFGWSKKEKNEKKMNQARVELARLTPKKRGEKLSSLRKRYPGCMDGDDYDFSDILFDSEMIMLYMLLIDELAVEEADLFDNPVAEVVGDTIPMDSIEDVQEQLSQITVGPEITIDHSHLSDSSSISPPTSTPDPTPSPSPSPSPSSFDSDSSSDRYSGGGSSFDSGGGSCDSGSGDCGGGDCGGD